MLSSKQIRRYIKFGALFAFFAWLLLPFVKSEKYDHMEYSTISGHSIQFKVYPSNFAKMRVDLISHRREEKNLSLEFKWNPLNAILMHFNRRGFTQSIGLGKKKKGGRKLKTGSWTHLYMVKGDEKYKIHNKFLIFNYEVLRLKVEKAMKKEASKSLEK